MEIVYFTAKSVRGVDHIYKNMPNEDSILLADTGSHSLVAAVSDGHGSEACFRAQSGSRFAVKILENICQTAPDFVNMDIVRQFAESLPERIVQQWKTCINNDLISYPYSQAEQSDDCKANFYLPYGCTLLGCYLTPQYGIFLQVGDGDMFALFPDGCTKLIVPGDDRLTGRATASLCLTDAAKDFRISIVDFSEERLNVLILATDGVGNSHPTDKDLFKWAPDLKKIMEQEDGRDVINENLATWLDDTSSNGSGDDCSMAIVFMENVPLDHPQNKGTRKGKIKAFYSKVADSIKSNFSSNNNSKKS